MLYPVNIAEVLPQKNRLRICYNFVKQIIKVLLLRCNKFAGEQLETERKVFVGL